MYWRIFVALLLSAGVVFLPVQVLGDDPPVPSKYSIRANLYPAMDYPYSEVVNILA